MSTIRQQIFEAVVAQLKTINTGTQYQFYGVTGNYQSNIGSKVFAWRSAPATQDSEYPFLVVRDLDESVKEPSAEAKRVEKQLHMLINIVTRGNNAADELRKKYYPDIEIALGVGARNRWGLNTGATRPKLTRSLFEQESDALAGGVVEFYIDYPQYAWYPFSV